MITKSMTLVNVGPSVPSLPAARASSWQRPPIPSPLRITVVSPPAGPQTRISPLHLVRVTSRPIFCFDYTGFMFSDAAIRC